MKMSHKTKIGVLIVCTACFVTIWRVTNFHLSWEAVGEHEEEEKNIESFTKLIEKLKTESNYTNTSCSCATCMSEYNEFFMKRYDKSVNPFLTPQENLTQDDYRWWTSLQHESGDLMKFKEAKDRIFKLFPTRLDLTEPGPDRCRTCAVVGNSGNLKGSKYGSQIDAHDIVIRMNGGITKGYEEDVGTKTTHRVMYPESAINLDNTTHLVLFAFKIMDLRWVVEAFTTGFHGRSYAPIISKITANKNLVMVVNPAFMKYVHKSWLSGRGGYPSTGFMTLVLSLHICDEVKVFGFGADKNGNWYHYWEVLRNTKLKTGLHPGMSEYGQIQELAKQKKVTFVRGW